MPVSYIHSCLPITVSSNDEMIPWTMIILIVLSVVVVLIVATIIVILILLFICLIILKKGINFCMHGINNVYSTMIIIYFIQVIIALKHSKARLMCTMHIWRVMYTMLDCGMYCCKCDTVTHAF